MGVKWRKRPRHSKWRSEARDLGDPLLHSRPFLVLTAHSYLLSSDLNTIYLIKKFHNTYLKLCIPDDWLTILCKLTGITMQKGFRYCACLRTTNVQPTRVSVCPTQVLQTGHLLVSFYSHTSHVYLLLINVHPLYVVIRQLLSVGTLIPHAIFPVITTF